MAIRLAFDLDANVETEKPDPLMRLTEPHCVVYQTLRARALHRFRASVMHEGRV